MFTVGFSHTLLVYGMTGSGKTFTMFGDSGMESTASVAGSTALTHTVVFNLTAG